MAAFKPVPPALAERYLACLPDDQRIERRRMFGCPCAFINGNMFSGLHEDRLVLRLPAAERQHVLAVGEALPFEVMGRTMREYVILPAPLDLAPEDVRAWIARAFAFGASLPPKQVRARSGKGRTKSESPRSRRRPARA